MFLYIIDIEIHTNIFMRHKTPLKQVRFKRIPPWFALEPSLFHVNQAWLELQPRHYFTQASLVQGGCMPHVV